MLCFEDIGIKVIRMGLHASETVELGIVAGLSPAFKEIVESRIYRNKIEDIINKSSKDCYNIYVNAGSISKALGHKK